jgi:hypothetical protein
MENINDKIVIIRRAPPSTAEVVTETLIQGVKSTTTTLLDTAFERPSTLAMLGLVATIGKIAKDGKAREAKIREEASGCIKGMTTLLCIMVALLVAIWYSHWGAYPILLLVELLLLWMLCDIWDKLKELEKEGAELQSKCRKEARDKALVVLGVDFTTRAMVKAYFKRFHPTEKESTIETFSDLLTSEDFVAGVAFTTAMVVGWGPVDSLLKVLKIKSMFGVLSGIVPFFGAVSNAMRDYLIGSDADRSRGFLTGVVPETFLRIAMRRMRAAPVGSWRHRFWAGVIRRMPRWARTHTPHDVVDAAAGAAPSAIVTGIGLYAAYRVFFPRNANKADPPVRASKEAEVVCKDAEPPAEAKTRKALGKGKGKTKGRGIQFRATGARLRRIRKNVNLAATGKKATRSADQVYWYEDDQVEVYDPVSKETATFRFDSARIKDLQKRARDYGLGDQFVLTCLRTNEVVYGDGHIAVADDQPDDEWLAEQEQREWEEIHGQDAYDYDEDDDFGLEAKAEKPNHAPEEPKEEAKEDAADASGKPEVEAAASAAEPGGATGPPQESRLGKSSLVDSSVVAGRVFHPSLVKDGVEAPGCSMSAFVVGQKVLMMKHWFNNTDASVFVFEIGGVRTRISKEDCVQVKCCPKGELMAFQKPPALKLKSSTITLREPPEGGGSCLVRTTHLGADKTETSSGKLFPGGKHDCPTVNGWCGSPVISTGEHQPAVVGFHFLGDGGDGTNGYIPLTGDLIRYLKVNAFPGNGI